MSQAQGGYCQPAFPNGEVRHPDYSQTANYVDTYKGEFENEVLWMSLSAIKTINNKDAQYHHLMT